MTPTDKPMTVEAMMKNMCLAWYLGQRYRQQADSESYADNKRSRLTLDEFIKLLEASRAAIEQYGREQYARGVNDAWPAGRGRGVAGTGVAGEKRAEGVTVALVRAPGPTDPRSPYGLQFGQGQIG